MQVLVEASIRIALNSLARSYHATLVGEMWGNGIHPHFTILCALWIHCKHLWVCKRLEIEQEAIEQPCL